MAMTQHAHPSWYTHDDDTAWERVKEAFRRDWQQTKYDFGGNEPDLNQGVGDTVSQMAGSKAIPPANVPNPDYEEDEDIYQEDDDTAYRYGYAAFRHYGDNRNFDEMDERLRGDYGDDAEYERQRRAIRHGWFFAKNESCHCDDA